MSLPMPRCCPRHIDWVTLAAHLVLDFSEMTAQEVLQELWMAKEAITRVDLCAADDALLIAELIARHRLSLRSGRITDVARLDPEQHSRRSPHALRSIAAESLGSGQED
jgi:hypothetical protein